MLEEIRMQKMIPFNTERHPFYVRRWGDTDDDDDLLDGRTYDGTVVDLDSDYDWGPTIAVPDNRLLQCKFVTIDTLLDGPKAQIAESLSNGQSGFAYQVPGALLGKYNGQYYLTELLLVAE